VGSKYRRSLELLKRAKGYFSMDYPVITKTGIMLGLGEEKDELLAVMDDLLEHSVDVLTLGQYLQPTKQHLPVIRHVHPDEFAALREIALQKGFKHCESGPLVRSSYHAHEHVPQLEV
jgi:lipoic acid synthetase